MTYLIFVLSALILSIYAHFKVNIQPALLCNDIYGGK
jgi:hypothetical protein